jgi:CRP/FNR family transcriptional regulator
MGEVLFDIGRPGQSFLMLTTGSIRVTRPSNEREILLYRVRPGECCILTISGILGGIQYPARAIAENNISGVALPTALFKQMVEQSPLFSAFIFYSLAARLSELLELVEAVTFMSLEKRLAGLLLTKDPVIQATHSQLADELGSVREVISRILKDFEGKGMVQLERGQVRILDKEALDKIAGPFGD